MTIESLSLCWHGFEYHYNMVHFFTLFDCHTLFLSQGNLRISRNQFWFLLNLHQNSAKIYPSQKLEYPSHKHATYPLREAYERYLPYSYLFKILFLKLTLGKGLECVEVQKFNQILIVLKHKHNVVVIANLLMILSTFPSIYQ